MSYVPKPIDTSKIELPDDQPGLVRELARNVHENWAAKRIAEGWTFGPVRDERKKQHPCLVAYEDLPEFEKDYDREIVEQTIRAMLAIGVKIDFSDASV